MVHQFVGPECASVWNRSSSLSFGTRVFQCHSSHCCANDSLIFARFWFSPLGAVFLTVLIIIFMVTSGGAILQRHSFALLSAICRVACDGEMLRTMSEVFVSEAM